MTPSMNTPGAPPLSTEPVHLSQPMPPSGGVTAGRLVRLTISVWWRNILKFTAVTMVTLVPALAVVGKAALALVRRTGGPGGARPDLARLGLVVVLLMPLLAAAIAIQAAALTYGAAQQLAGRPVRVGAMLAAGLRRALPVMAAGVIVLVIVASGTLLLIVPGIIVMCASIVTIPAVVMERMGPIAAIGRSWHLTDGYRLKFLAASFALGLAGSAVNLAAQVAIAVAGRAAPLVIPLFMVVYLLVLSVHMLLPAVTYHEVRTAKEGIGTEDLAKVFE